MTGYFWKLSSSYCLNVAETKSCSYLDKALRASFRYLDVYFLGLSTLIKKIYSVPKENNHETNYTKKNCSPSNNLSMNRRWFSSVHDSGNLSIE